MCIDLYSKYLKAFGFGVEKSRKIFEKVKLSFLHLARETTLSNKKRMETSENSVFEEMRNV